MNIAISRLDEIDESHLPDVEDINDAEEKTMVVNKIRISKIKGSHTSFVSPRE